MPADRLKAMESLLGMFGIKSPVSTTRDLVASFTTDGELQAEYAALREDEQRQRLVDMLLPHLEVRSQLDDMQEQLDQLLTLLLESGRKHDLPRPSGSSRFLRLLDRTPAWDALTVRCVIPGHRGFIVHGSRGQNVALFCARVRERAGTLPAPHDIVEVNYTVAEHIAVSAEDWDSHLEQAIGSWSGLTERTAARPLLVMLCDGARPLRSMRKGERIGLGKQAREGLTEFLQALLPSRIEAANCKHPVRVLVPIEYPATFGPEVDDVLFCAIETALRNSSLDYERMLPLTFPSWVDVADSIQKIHGARVSGSLLAASQIAYTKEADHPEPERDFERLARALDAVLDDHTEAD